ncbi:L10-interacting MYB domain-containing protein [Sphaceloma murrayae]|uniref:L10-interacting MYB domain-containing protein n=1 Tax=Sphaceloma murrayae TaxID=2082308 RepID=A0A2K1R0T6_9PEZI|nr:L10-interacting MYB domain-containing protein [Sphaceloma murrayae]
MIEQGKAQGWLNLAPEALQPWAALNNVELHHVKVSVDPQHPERGAGVFADRDTTSPEDGHTVLMTVPRDLILSKDLVEQHAKVDKALRAILDDLGEFGQSPRLHILTFLLTQTHVLCPSPSPFTHHPLSTYLRLLPLEPLPTTYSGPERSLLKGTTLLPALTAKLSSLSREHASFLSKTTVSPAPTLEDWTHLDAIYRSRALEFPHIGDCMAPCIDMANHASGSSTRAIYDVDAGGDAVLLLREGQTLPAGDEVTITYGDAKGACEMVFSYGFLEDGMQGARELFLDVRTMGDDPLGKAKRAVAGVAPGVKLFERGDHVRWEGEWLWLVVVNEEDGLEFMLRRTMDGEEELVAFWRGEEVCGAVELRERLEREEMWDVWSLRAVSVLQERVEEQLRELYGSDEEVNGTAYGEGTETRERVRRLAMKLRELESDLLEKAYAYLEEEKERLMTSGAVVKYLMAMNTSNDPDPPGPAELKSEEEDFS